MAKEHGPGSGKNLRHPVQKPLPLRGLKGRFIDQPDQAAQLFMRDLDRFHLECLWGKSRGEMKGRRVALAAKNPNALGNLAHASPFAAA
jgi:hypothetical protein